MRPDGKGSRPHVFSLVPTTAMRTGPVLEVAASSQEELKEWVLKIREVTMTSEAKVCASTWLTGNDSYPSQGALWAQRTSLDLCSPVRGSAADTLTPGSCQVRQRCARQIVSGPSHPGHEPFELLPYGKRLRSVMTETVSVLLLRASKTGAMTPQTPPSPPPPPPSHGLNGTSLYHG